MTVIRKRNKWFNSKHIRCFVFDTKRNDTAKLFLNQSRAEYDPETKVVTITYHTEKLLDERKAERKIKYYIKEEISPSRSIVTVEYVPRHIGEGSRVQCVFLSKTEPSNEAILKFEEFINELTVTIPKVVQDDPQDDECDVPYEEVEIDYGVTVLL